MALETVVGGGPRVRSKALLPARYFMAVMGSIGLAIVYGFKVNTSVAIVAMVNHTGINALLDCNLTTQPINHSISNYSTLEQNSTESPIQQNTTNPGTEDGPFLWDKQIQGMILSAYFGGYLLSQLPGGRIAELFSARWVMNGSVMLNALASALSPLCIYLDYPFLMVMRILQGLGGGVTFPAMHVMIAKWAPPDERSVLSSIVYAGTALGTVISLLVSGGLAVSLGWESVFYVEGVLSLIWCLGWWFLIEDSPEEQRLFITQEEKDYIANSLGQRESIGEPKKKLPVPWRLVWSSLPFWAILVAHICSNFGWYMLLIELPIYMKQVLKFSIAQNAGISAMPYLCMWLFTMILSKVLALMQVRGFITKSWARKIATLFASVVPLACLLTVTHVTNTSLAVFLMTLGVIGKAGMFSGFLSNHIDIAPNFAGTLVAITNTFATIPGIIVPLFVGKMTEKQKSCSLDEAGDDQSILEAWRTIFFVTAGFYVIEILTYTIFGTAEEQPWNKVECENEAAGEQMLPLKDSKEKTSD